MVHHTATRTTLDPADPFVLDVREVGRRPGSSRAMSITAAAPAGLGIELISVPEGDPVRGDLRLSSVVEGVLVTGTVDVEARGECGRCLDPVRVPVQVELAELWAYPDSATEQTTEAEDVRRLDGYLLDLGPAVRDAVVLALPSTPLCAPDCAGLCSVCGVRLADDPAGHGHEQADPRWSALAQFHPDHGD